MRYCTYKWVRTSIKYVTKKGNEYAYGKFHNGSTALLFPVVEKDKYGQKVLKWIAPREKTIFELNDDELIQVYKDIDADNKQFYMDHRGEFAPEIIKGFDWRVVH
jgi:hypothetical protein